MAAKDYQENLARFENLVRNRSRDRTMVSLIIDSPWLPGYAGLNTLDFFFDSFAWLKAYEKVHQELDTVAFVPDVWVEFGMAAEPSGFGVKVKWSKDSPPGIHAFPKGLNGLLETDLPDPEKDGLMPVVLRQYERMTPLLKEKGIAPRMAAARGPLAVASHLMGITELLIATQLEAEDCLKLVEKTTDLCIQWLSCQLARMEDPLGVLVLDDVVGLISPEDAKRFAIPQLQRIFDVFPDLIHLFHNDTPNRAVYPSLSSIGMDVFNFSHEFDIQEVRSLVGPEVVLMGNIPPLDVLVRGTPDQVRKSTQELLQKAFLAGPILISPGGGVSPGTPIENLKAMVEAVKMAK